MTGRGELVVCREPGLAEHLLASAFSVDLDYVRERTSILIRFEAKWGNGSVRAGLAFCALGQDKSPINTCTMIQEMTEANTDEPSQNIPMTEPAIEPAPASAPQGQASRYTLASYWWIPASFIFPYILASRRPNIREVYTNPETIGFGLVGLAAALTVYVLWYLDSAIGARQKISQITARTDRVLVYILGFFLWLCMASIFAVIFMAANQIMEKAPQLSL